MRALAFASILAALALISGAAYARMSLGIGLGIPETAGAGGYIAPVASYLLLHTASGKITLHGGGSILCHAC